MPRSSNSYLGTYVQYIGDNRAGSITDHADVGRPISSLERECDTPKQALGAVITELRTRRGWGYEHVAHRVGCSPGYMNAIEHGKQNPTFDVLQAIADLHGLKLSRLLALGERKHERCSKKKKAAGAVRRAISR